MTYFRAMRTDFAAGAVLDDRMLEVSWTMKAQGMIMHRMSFRHSPDIGTRTLSATCALDEKTHLNAARGGELREHLARAADAPSTRRSAG
jgi:hypothetical protein